MSRSSSNLSLSKHPLLQQPGLSGVLTSVITTPTSMDLRTPFRISLVLGRTSANPLQNLRLGLSGGKPSVTTTLFPGPSVSLRLGLNGVPTSGTTMPTSIPLLVPSRDSPNSNANPLLNRRLGRNGAPTLETTTPTNTPLLNPSRGSLNSSASPLLKQKPGPSGVPTSGTTMPTSTGLRTRYPAFLVLG